MTLLHHPVDERNIVPAQARSSQAYQINETDKYAIIRVTTFHRRDYSLALVSFGPRSSSSMRSSLRAPFPSIPIGGIGGLDRLPREIICEVLRYLDRASTLSFRQASRQARQIVSTLPEYRVATQHAMDAILALCKTGMAAHFTLGDIRAILNVENCPLCGEFGGFVFLPTLQRCSPATEAEKRRTENTGTTAAGPGPMVRWVPGTYGMAETKCKERFWLTATKPTAKSNPKPLYRYMVATALPYVNFRAKGAAQIQHGVSCTGCQISVEKNVAMHGDMAGYYIADLRDRVYSRDGYLEHFKWCREAQIWWDSSVGGTVSVKIPFGARKGGSFRSLNDGFCCPLVSNLLWLHHDAPLFSIKLV
ncbi:hypothetical protein C8A01DRAFT_42475 [Parachaetomium inaequale]|uniref:F-box domain-containing protein n=1 Tax=Parachaetomium inaequale TaxID=2588326 RepID=A0AAN6PU17_9PEZI|nr:hypothetical protein C8A01DRAFT_42475 [Parachaetomium inaequale]